jgi:hypothetical protein
MRSIVGRIESASRGAMVLARRSERLNALQAPPPLRDVSAVARVVQVLQRAGEHARRLAEESRVRGEQFESLKQQWLEAIRQAGTCPTCGQEFEPDVLLAKAEFHLEQECREP